MHPVHPQVLIVDDDPILARVHSQVLENRGYAVSVVGTGEQALERLDRCRPDVILLDILLPGKDGIEVARELSSRADVAGIPIVMITGAHSFPVGLGMEGLESLPNICRFLYKPCDEVALVQGIHEALVLHPQGEPR